MTSGDPRTAVLLCDAFALRRAAYLSLLDPWAIGNNVRIVASDYGSISPADPDVNFALEILVLGAAHIEDHAVQSQLAQRRRSRPDIPLVLVSDHEDRAEVTAAFRHAARGFIPSSLEPDLARQALGFILAGGTFFPPHILDRSAGDDAEIRSRQRDRTASLTPRQLDVLALLREGKSNKLIARNLSMCESTVKVHVRQIMRKLGAANRTQAALSGIGVARSGVTGVGTASTAIASTATASTAIERPAVTTDTPRQASRSVERRFEEHPIPHGLQQSRAR